jgi:hypothetical protein
MPLFLFSTHKQYICIKTIAVNSIAMISLEPHTRARLEPGSSVPEAGAMSTTPRLQDCNNLCSPWLFLTCHLATQINNFAAYFIHGGAIFQSWAIKKLFYSL